MLVSPQDELEALLAVEIAAVGFAGHKFLRQSQHHLDEVYVLACSAITPSSSFGFSST
jgi:hypothetical protein